MSVILLVDGLLYLYAGTAGRGQVTVAQSLRSIPDALERKHGLTPEQAEAAGITIDAVLADLAEEFETNVFGDPNGTGSAA